MTVKDKTITSNSEILDKADILFNQGQFAKALQIYKEILPYRFSDYIIWRNIGTSLQNLGYYDSAVIYMKRAYELRPDSLSVLRYYARCLMFVNRKAEALHIFSLTARFFPDDFLAICDYAFALREFDMHEEALIQFNSAHAKEPEEVEVIWQRSTVYLSLGRFKEGWQDFESRWKLSKDHVFWVLADQEKKFKSQRWTGQDLNGKTILVYGEQGFGDTIFSSRYIPMVKERGGEVIFRTAPELLRLFRTIPCIDRLVENININEKIDYHVPIMSLPGLFSTDLNTIPPPLNFDIQSPLSTEAARLLNLAKDRFKVGIIWSGRPTFGGNYKRAAPFKHFLSLMETPGVQFYSLQKGPAEQELVDCGAQGIVLELGSHLKDFSDTAAVLKNLDLVIMTDSSVAHLAGSIGCPIWNMLSTGAYWVYLKDREDSPWYSSMRLFRQPEPGDWDSVFAIVTKELETAVQQKKAGKWPDHDRPATVTK